MNKCTKAKIKEIFVSIQGEGPFIGYNQLFIRFCNCNLKCNFCDTEFNSDKNYMEFTPLELLEKIKEYDLDKIHSISLTGGEPLLSTDFLKEFLPLVDKNVYLETNATLVDKLEEVKHFVDYISADIKLESATGIKDTFKFHDLFFEECKGIQTFAKIVFNNKITDEEIVLATHLAKKYNLELILQPETIENKLGVSSKVIKSVYDKFLQQYSRVRVIPQVHVFLGVE